MRVIVSYARVWISELSVGGGVILSYLFKSENLGKNFKLQIYLITGTVAVLTS